MQAKLCHQVAPQRDKTRGTSISRPLQIDIDQPGNGVLFFGQDQNAVGKENSFFQIMCDKDHRYLLFAPYPR